MSQTHPAKVIRPPATILVVGLGKMGLPMAERLIDAGFSVRGVDLSESARQILKQKGAEVYDNTPGSAAEAANGVAAVITMLPDGKIVRDALLGTAGYARHLPADALVLDMSSSSPVDTVSLGNDLARVGLHLIDAPVSGGVKRAEAGSLAVMAGGSAEDIERGRFILETLGGSLFITGALGSGHAMKGLNNYVSAAGLTAAVEALLIGREFGLDPNLIIDVLNVSTGRNNATDVKMKQFIISETYGSGFSLALMSKDIRTALDLAEHLKLKLPQISALAGIWTQAQAKLEPGVDHTEIIRYLTEGGT